MICLNETKIDSRSLTRILKYPVTTPIDWIELFMGVLHGGSTLIYAADYLNSKKDHEAVWRREKKYSLVVYKGALQIKKSNTACYNPFQLII